MMIKKFFQKQKYSLLLIVLIMIYILGLFASSTRLTYLEYTTVNEEDQTFIALGANGNELKQEFIMPYSILDSISIKIGTFGKDNNSTWIFSILDLSGKVLCTDEFNASGIEDNEYYRIKLDKRINVQNGNRYYFSLKAKEVSELSMLAFYGSEGNNATDTVLSYNGERINNTLCFRIYGGDADYWWHGFITICFLYLLIIVYRVYLGERRDSKLKEDRILKGMVLGAATFMLWCIFANSGWFTDENDNIRGGLIIAEGGVLYRDYITQHTPVVYYLCAIFAKLGAGSIEQFRLSYYFFVGIVWFVLYMRHSSFYGDKRMLALPLLQAIVITSLISPQGYQILSDGFQGLMFTALTLEFLRYCEERTLNWDRCIIVSICIWGSFGAAFVSVYALIVFAVFFVYIELSEIVKHEINAKKIGLRYYKLFVALCVPLFCAVLYFKINSALYIAFEQFYKFNREVYPQYIDGVGENVIQPFISAIQYFVSVVVDNFVLLINSSASSITILKLSLLCGTIAIIIKLFEKGQVIKSDLFVGIMVFSAVRGYDFHGLAAWYIIVVIVVLYGDLLKETARKLGKTFIGILGIVLISTYVSMIGENLFDEQDSISEIESRVIEMTENDESLDIFLDAYCLDSLYLFYKGRQPMNPAVYMLPWYMDWYEEENVNALLEKSPRVVVYNEDRATWGIEHYNNLFDYELKKHYTRLGNEGWEYNVWVRNN